MSLKNPKMVRRRATRRRRPRLSVKELRTHGDSMLGHEFLAKVGRMKNASGWLRGNAKGQNTRKLGSELIEASDEIGEIIQSEGFYDKVQSRLLIGSRGTELSPEEHGRLASSFQRLEGLRDRVFESYQKARGREKKELEVIHHNVAALANSLQHLVLVKGLRNATGADMRKMTSDTLGRKFRALRARGAVARSIADDEEFKIGRGDLFLLKDNALENAEKAMRPVGGTLNSRVIRRRDGRLVLKIRSLGTLDEERFAAQRAAYNPGSSLARDYYAGMGGTGIVYALSSVLGGRCKVWRRKGPRGLHYYYFTVELPGMAKAA